MPMKYFGERVEEREAKKISFMERETWTDDNYASCSDRSMSSRVINKDASSDRYPSDLRQDRTDVCATFAPVIIIHSDVNAPVR